MSLTLANGDAALIDTVGERTLAGDELRAEIGRTAAVFAGLPPGVLLARTALDLASVLRYLGALAAARAVILIDTNLDADVLATLVERFRPAAVLGVGETAPPDGYVPVDVAGPAWARISPEGVAPHPDLALLLPTSGSTGNPKFVRLSASALRANAEAIATVLRIDSLEVAPTSLPLHYSYGMSVLNSHLLRGATVVIEPSGVMGRDFWRAVEEHGITSLAGVPYHYQMLKRLRFEPARDPTLRTLTQAGGKLSNDLVAEFNEKMLAVSGRMYVMYGQTEAGPRMSTVPAERLTDKLGSAGRALPGGEFAVRTENGVETTASGVTGEVIYRGPNVMMGYAQSEAELAAGDEQGGELVTGDLGYLDEEGYLFVTGRLTRIGKIFGNRVNLDDLEQILRQDAGLGYAAAVPAGDTVVVFLENADGEACKIAAKVLGDRLHLHMSGFDVRPSDALPLLPSGKVDYRTLEAQV